MSYTCEAYQQTALPTLVVASQIPAEGLPAKLGEIYGKVYQYLAGLGQPPAGAPFVAYYNMDMQNLTIEAGTVVAGPLPGEGDILASALPDRMVATVTYTGPYPGMGAAYEELTRWVQEHGYQASGVVYEFYLNNPADTAPEALQTQIVFVLN